jgi:hypothetical protein
MEKLNPYLQTFKDKGYDVDHAIVIYHDFYYEEYISATGYQIINHEFKATFNADFTFMKTPLILFPYSKIVPIKNEGKVIVNGRELNCEKVLDPKHSDKQEFFHVIYIGFVCNEKVKMGELVTFKYKLENKLPEINKYEDLKKIFRKYYKEKLVPLSFMATFKNGLMKKFTFIINSPDIPISRAYYVVSRGLEEIPYPRDEVIREELPPSFPLRIEQNFPESDTHHFLMVELR